MSLLFGLSQSREPLHFGDPSQAIPQASPSSRQPGPNSVLLWLRSPIIWLAVGTAVTECLRQKLEPVKLLGVEGYVVSQRGLFSTVELTLNPSRKLLLRTY